MSSAVREPDLQEPDGAPGGTAGGTAREAAGRLTMDVLFARAAAGLPCWVGDTDGVRTPLPLHRWLGASEAGVDGPGDAAVLARCTGPTIDLGCGPGRLTAALTARGVPALGVDTSAVAVRMTLARGALALQRDVFSPLPGAGRWQHVLLADGNVGIGGDPERLLRRCAELLGPDGTVVVELEAAGERTRRATLRLETDTGAGAWFPWAHLGPGAAARAGAAAGLRLLDVTHVHGRTLGVLTHARSTRFGAIEEKDRVSA